MTALIDVLLMVLEVLAYWCMGSAVAIAIGVAVILSRRPSHGRVDHAD